MDRREFIQTSVTAALFTGIGHTAAVRRPGRLSHAPLDAQIYKAVCDERYSDSLAFRDEVSRLAIPIYAIRGDVTNLWFNDLDAHWREHTAPVVGLTTDAALFCLEGLARDHHMRVLFRAEHAFKRHSVEHTFACSQAALECLDTFERETSMDWARRVAHMLASASFEEAPFLTRVVTTARNDSHTAPSDHSREFEGWWGPEPTEMELLVSWVIGPGLRT